MVADLRPTGKPRLCDAADFISRCLSQIRFHLFWLPRAGTDKRHFTEEYVEEHGQSVHPRFTHCTFRQPERQTPKHTSLPSDASRPQKDGTGRLAFNSDATHNAEEREKRQQKNCAQKKICHTFFHSTPHVVQHRTTCRLRRNKASTDKCHATAHEGQTDWERIEAYAMLLAHIEKRLCRALLHTTHATENLVHVWMLRQELLCILSRSTIRNLHANVALGIVRKQCVHDEKFAAKPPGVVPLVKEPQRTYKYDVFTTFHSLFDIGRHSRRAQNRPIIATKLHIFFQIPAFYAEINEIYIISFLKLSSPHFFSLLLHTGKVS